MSYQALLIGGLLPSVLLGVGTVIMKLGLRAGISLPIYLAIVGVAVLVYGAVATFFVEEKEISMVATGYALLMGVTWATAMLCMTYGLTTLKLPVSIVAPLSNSNALFAVLLSALVLSEWKNLDVTKVILGTLLIVAGAAVISASETPN